jgi:hypothetical protein
MVSQFLIRAVDDPSDDEARAQMLLAASYAGVGFGNAGVHLPHGMSYPVSGNVKSYQAPGYGADHPLVPHGISVILNAPAVFRFTASASPERHLQAAEALGADISNVRAEDAGKVLADRLVWYMQRLRTPNGLSAIGYTSADIPALVEGTLPQHRVTKLSPRPAGPEELAKLFENSMTVLRATCGVQQPTHLWLFLTPYPSSSLIVSGNGEMRCTGPLAMSTVVWPARLVIFGSAPFAIRYSIISLSPRAAALWSAVLPSCSRALTSAWSSSTRYLTAASMPLGANLWWFAANPSP